MVSVVVPTYNESENIIPLLKRLSKLADDVVVVDDNSPDGTGLMASEFGRNVKTIVRSCKMGLNGAILRGVLETQNDDVIVMDADFSHPPGLIPQIRDALENHNIVIASRTRVIGWGIQRHLISKIAELLAQVLYFRWKVSDPMSGFFGAKRSVIKKYSGGVSPQGYKLLFAMLKNYVRENGYSGITKVDYVFVDRRRGKSKLSMKVVMDYFKSVFKR
nr:glycosyltransferase [Candidatus Njordarchaeota archaeon]